MKSLYIIEHLLGHKQIEVKTSSSGIQIGKVNMMVCIEHSIDDITKAKDESI